MKHHRSERQGVVLVCVIACLAVATAIVGYTVQASLRMRRESRMQLQLRQAELLCEAGVRRAVAKLAADRQFAGEQWLPDLDAKREREAVVSIIVAREPASDVPQVTVTARLTADSIPSTEPQDLHAVQRTYQFAFTNESELPSKENE